jgi:hypothetical protein
MQTSAGKAVEKHPFRLRSGDIATIIKVSMKRFQNDGYRDSISIGSL